MDHPEGVGMFIDCTELPSFEEAQNYVKKANEDFEALDVHVRKKFQNNPQNLIDFIQDPMNVHEAVKLGLATYQEKPKVTPKSSLKAPSIPTEEPKT